MEDILEEPETIVEKDMFFTIWTKPTQTFTYIFKYCPTKHVNAIINIYGVANALAINLLFLLNHTSFSILLTVITALLGWLFAWLGVYILSSLMSWSGRWIGGHAGMDQFVTVSAWSYIPSIGSVFPLAVEAIIFGNSDSIYLMTDQNVVMRFLYYLLLIARVVLTIWSLVIFVKGTAVIQKVNYKKAILNVILVVSVMIVPIVIIAGLIYLL
jgi:Yip1 domain